MELDESAGEIRAFVFVETWQISVQGKWKKVGRLTRRLSDSDEGVLLRLLGYIVARFCINRKFRHRNHLSIDTNIRVSKFLLLIIRMAQIGSKTEKTLTLSSSNPSSGFFLFSDSGFDSVMSWSWEVVTSELDDDGSEDASFWTCSKPASCGETGPDLRS